MRLGLSPRSAAEAAAAAVRLLPLRAAKALQGAAAAYAAALGSCLRFLVYAARSSRLGARDAPCSVGLDRHRRAARAARLAEDPWRRRLPSCARGRAARAAPAVVCR